jgi:hypothetical protein
MRKVKDKAEVGENIFAMEWALPVFQNTHRKESRLKFLGDPKWRESLRR